MYAVDQKSDDLTKIIQSTVEGNGTDYRSLPDRKRKILDQYVRLMRWGRCNPVPFIETVYGLDLFDIQALTIHRTWLADISVWNMSRNAAKTTTFAIYGQARAMLFPNYKIWILSRTGSQARECFKKMQDIAYKKIASFGRTTDVLEKEIMKISLDPENNVMEFFNGSSINTANSILDNIRGKRANLIFYDEAGFISEAFYAGTRPFANQDANFHTGASREDRAEVPQNQIIYASSASDKETPYYTIYKNAFIQMMSGNSSYYVTDINCENLFVATMKGKRMETPLISEEKVMADLLDDPEKAAREHYNRFESDGGVSQVFKRAVILNNSEVRLPVLYNDNPDKRFIISFDPARSYDQSAVIIGELKDHKNGGKMVEICNGMSLLNPDAPSKTPKSMPEQIEYIRDLILSYNIKQDDYTCIDSICVDAGAGGGGKLYGDILKQDWYDSAGILHRGLCDPEEQLHELINYPNAARIVKLVSPVKYKVVAFDYLREMLMQGRITFPDDYQGENTLSLIDQIDGKMQEVSYELTYDEKVALTHITLAKKELSEIYRYESVRGSHTYDINKEKTGRLYDDRAYCLALIALRLGEINRQLIAKAPNQVDLTKFFMTKQIDGFKREKNIFGTTFKGFK